MEMIRGELLQDPDGYLRSGGKIRRVIRYLARRMAAMFGLATIDIQTAEYISCMLGQVRWGNTIQYNRACQDVVRSLLGKEVNAMRYFGS